MTTIVDVDEKTSLLIHLGLQGQTTHKFGLRVETETI